MGTYYDPDIQNAPVYPVEISVKNKENKDEPYLTEKNKKIDFIITCTIYIPNNFWVRPYATTEDFIYFTVLGNNQVIAQRIGKLPEGEKFAKYTVPFSITNNSGLSELNLQFAYTPKHQGESGIGESLRIGRFFYTIIPIRSTDKWQIIVKLLICRP